jgi:hypothetical protein
MPERFRHGVPFGRHLILPSTGKAIDRCRLGHRNIQNTVRYTATNPARFEKLWR